MNALATPSRDENLALPAPGLTALDPTEADRVSGGFVLLSVGLGLLIDHYIIKPAFWDN